MSSSSSTNNNTPAMSINALLKKTEHYDKDERYMATSDLCELLKRHGSNSNNTSGSSSSSSGGGSHTTNTNNNNNGGGSDASFSRMDVTTERRICTAVLRLLHDKSNDVQAIAVKTLGVLLTTVQQEQVLEIADSLADQVLDAGKTELRDVYAIGLRTLVKTVPSTMGDAVSQRLVGRLLDGIRTSGKEEIVLCCLDILTDVLGRFGATALSVARQHEPILQMSLHQLTMHPSAVVRKRAGTTMGCLSVVLSDPLLVRMVEALLSQIDRAEGLGRSVSQSSNTAAAATTTTITTTSMGRKLPPAPVPFTTTATTTSSSSQIGDTRALIRTMCTISGAVGHRLGQAQIDRMIPIFLRFTDPEDAITGDDEEDHDDDEQQQQQQRQASQHKDARMKDDNDEDDDDDDDDDNVLPGSTKRMSEDEAATESANELRESCFMGFESFVLRCPTEVEPHMDKIIQAALAYMSYDPNYSYGVDETNEAGNNGGDEEEMEMQDEEEEDEFEQDDNDDDEDEDDDDDDDDESWKVRRSAIRALKAVVEAKKHDPSSLWTRLCKVRRGKTTIFASALVGRFKEREENCRVDVIDCFTRLLTVTVKAASAGVVCFQSADAVVVMDDAAATNKTSSTTTTTTGATVAAAAVAIDLRTQYAPNLVKACEKLLSIRKGGDRSKSSALALLATLCKAPGGVGGAAQIQSVFRHIQAFLAKDPSHAASTTSLQARDSSSKTLRLDALSLIHTMLANNNHNPVDIRKGLLSTILPELCQAVKEQWYKVIAEALRALAQVPRFFLIGYDDAVDKDGGGDDDATKQKERDYVANCLYNAVEPLLAAHDVDQEIKECALSACASILSSLHTNLSSVPQKQRLLSLLLDRLKNETTRIAAIRTLSAVAAGIPTATNIVSVTPAVALSDTNRMDEEVEKIDLSPILSDAISTMASFLKLQSRSLKQSSLEALYTVVTNHGSSDPTLADGELYASLLQEVGNLIVDSDLHLSHLSLRVSVAVLKVCPACGPSVKSFILPNTLVLSTSPLLQDLALDSLLATLQQMVVSDVVDFHELLNMLRTRLDNGSGVGKNTLGNLAKCIAVITAATSPENRSGVISQTLSSLEGIKTPSEMSELRHIQLSLLVSGDLGRTVDLSAMEGVADRLQAIYLAYFDSSSEDLKLASAYALGRAAIGAKAVFLPVIVGSLEQNSQKKQYLLLSALREFIQCYQHAGSDDVETSIALIIPHLERHCSDKEEGVRTMVAECLGSLTCLQPAMLLPKLQEIVNDHSSINAPDGTVPDGDTDSKTNALACWTVATSIKLAIAGKVDPSQLATFIPNFLTLLQQQELSVRNAALLMVYSAVHHMPQILAGLMKDLIIPSLYEVATFKLERKVDLGPFTHTVDDALPLRKAALSIFATCVENLPASLDISAFMPILAKALGDVEDVQLQAYQIVCSMCVRQPTYLVAAVEGFVDPLEKTINKKAGQKMGTELERLNDWIKGALRAMLALSHLEGAMNCRKFADLCERTRMNSKFRGIMESLEEER